MTNAIKLGLVKKDINPGISAIAFLGLIQTTVTVWSYKNFNFVPQKIHDIFYDYYVNNLRFLPNVFFTVFCAVADFALNKTDGVWYDRKNNCQVFSNTLWTSRKVNNECLFVYSGDSP